MKEIRLEEIIEMLENYKEQEKRKVQEPLYFEFGESYWYVNGAGEVNNVQWRDLYCDHYRFNQGLCFTTAEEAKRKLDIQKYLMEHSYQFTKEDWKNINLKKCYIQVDRYEDAIDYAVDYDTQVAQWYFKTREECKSAIEFIGYNDYIKYVLNERG